MKKMISNIMFYTLVLLNFSSVVFGITLPSQAETTLKEVAEIFFIIGAGVCIFKVIQIGIMYVTSSAIDKSNAKAAILPWLIGTFVCFGAATLGQFIIELFYVDRNVLQY